MGEIKEKVIEKKKQFFRDQLPFFQIVFWDNKDPLPDQFEALPAAISKAMPIKVQAFEELEQRIQELAKGIQTTDIVPVLYKGKARMRALLELANHHENQCITFNHVEKTSGYGITTFLSLGFRKLFDRDETEWFKHKPTISPKLDPIDLKINITGVASTPSSSSVSCKVRHEIEGKLILLRSEMTFPACAFGQYEVKHTIDYNLEYKLPTYSIQPGEHIVMEPIGDNMEKYIQQAKAEVLVDFFQLLKRDAQQQHKP
jgi:hypothetical protein